MEDKGRMGIVIVGHVDHGKSTLIGRLLYDTDSLPRSIIEDVEKICKELGKKMEFAYILDSLEEEREQNVTIDTTQIFFKTPKRDYVIIDAPGHIEFIKNMVTGASQAKAAILVVDANEGLQEQTKRHAYILKLLALKHVIVVVNKMDSAGYNQESFNKVKSDINEFLGKLDTKPRYIIPISAVKGDNIVKKSSNMQWYDGLSVSQALDMFKVDVSTSDVLRFPIQDVYKIDDKRILVGRIEAGSIKQGDEVVFFPSNKKTKIKSIEVWGKKKTEAESGESIGITLDDPLFIERGEVVCSGGSPKISDEFKANIFWMSKNPININEKLVLRCSTQEVGCVLDKIEKKINSSSLRVIGENCKDLKETEVGNVMIKAEKPILMENFNGVNELGRFVLVKNDNAVAGGVFAE